MKKQFEDYLIKKGYSVKTPSGNPSTVYAYIKSIDRICKDEHITWDVLYERIGDIVRQYDKGGAKESFGSKSNKTWINALKRFQDYITETVI